VTQDPSLLRGDKWKTLAVAIQYKTTGNPISREILHRALRAVPFFKNPVSALSQSFSQQEEKFLKRNFQDFCRRENPFCAHNGMSFFLFFSASGAFLLMFVLIHRLC
jgi:hypothetical protein